MMDSCNDYAYNINDYCIMFDDVLGFEDCVFLKQGIDDDGVDVD